MGGSSFISYTRTSLWDVDVPFECFDHDLLLTYLKISETVLNS